MSNNNIPENALFVCFSGMPNKGSLTGLASLQAVRRLNRTRLVFFAWAGCQPRTQ
jgi:hypothetical protein